MVIAGDRLADAMTELVDAGMRLYDIEAAAELLGLSPSRLREEVKLGRLRYTHEFGPRLRRISAGELKRYVHIYRVNP